MVLHTQRSKREAVLNCRCLISGWGALYTDGEKQAKSLPFRSLPTQQPAPCQLQITAPKAPSDDRAIPKPIGSQELRCAEQPPARCLLTWSRPESRTASWAPRTLGGDCVLGTARGGGLCAVAAGALQRVSAAPLRVQLEAP